MARLRNGSLLDAAARPRIIASPSGCEQERLNLLSPPSKQACPGVMQTVPSFLHDVAIDLAEQIAMTRFGRTYDMLADEEQGAVRGNVATRLRKNTFDPRTGTLTLAVGDHGFFDCEQTRWKRYFELPAENGNLRRNAILDDGELKALNAFFAWAT